MVARNLSYIQPGESISAAITNRPLKELALHADRLDKRLLESESGVALILRDAPVDESVTEAMPVYWKVEESKFYPACAMATRNCNTGEYESDACADCMGLVYKKTSSDMADIFLSGVLDLPQIRSIIPSGSGRFFLGVDAGSLTFDSPVVQAPVGAIIGPTTACDERVLVYVNPEYPGKTFHHLHYARKLNCMLWESASGKKGAPANAVLRYKLEQDSELKRYFPPIPLDACSCTIDWNGRLPNGQTISETFGGREIPIHEENSILKINHYGIWWMTSDFNPVTIAESNPTNSYKEFRITVYFSRIQYANYKAYVTSLQPDENEPFEFVDCYGQTARTGDLFARFTLASDLIDASEYTGTAIKQLNSDWKQERVPVIHGIRSLNNNLVLSGTTFTKDGKNYYKGLVDLKVSPYSEDYELRPQIVRLGDALEKEYQDIQYLSLPSGRNSSLIFKMEVPGVFGLDLSVKMRFCFLSRIQSTYPQLTLQYMTLPRPKNGAITLAGYTNYSNITWDTTENVVGNSIFELNSPSISVQEGDTLIWKLSRVKNDGFTSDVGIIRATGILNAGGIR